jgi:hypothetical protein
MEEKEVKLDKQDHKSLVLWATDCAEHVLPYFEEQYPNDPRPRKAVEAGRAWVRDEITMSEARTAAHAAARSAARAAGHAAATAHVADHAVHAAAYALTSTDTTEVRACERDWQYQHLPKHLQHVVFPSHDKH